ncbi:MAG: flagellar basal body rod protein FlgC [Candidatus Saganbacteria bacterium]|jgi:flagellar basal-body rod protein FlgC|nr:flagellar basal body rod protein FlgC [Candidatus Saganbacteria bacterium]
MGLNQAFDISVSGINAQRVRMEIIASNLANIDSTRSLEGGPYRRKVAVLGEKPLSFPEILSDQEKQAGGVEVVEIAEDGTPFQKVYNPGHPDADKDGFVTLPNVSLSKEMVDMTYVQKLYEANITAYNVTKKMAQDTLQLP